MGPKLRTWRVYVWVAFVFWSALATAKLQHQHFPVDKFMRPRVDFWKSVYTKISSGQGYLHDTEDVSIIYKTLDVSGMSRRRKQRYIRSEKKQLKAQILNLIGKPEAELSGDQRRLKDLIGERTEGELRNMAVSVRFQQGMRDRYYQGLIRSYQYLDRIRKILRKEGVPEELAFLPHVESSFNYQAYSKVGAAGIWQFMRATARLYKLRINYVIDERRDPIAATKAAAKFLKANYKRLKAWPLAVTAYNHGPASIARAIKRTNSREISTIIDQYQARRFGFASKNFYATFMAAVEISKKPEDYFSFIPKPRPSEYSSFRLERSLTIKQISKILGIEVKTLKEYNLPLRPIAFRAQVYLPENYRLRVPKASSDVIVAYSQKIAAAKIKAPKDQGSRPHIVSRGESLYSIARSYRVNMMDIIAYNGISNPSRIYPGLKLKIPGKGAIIEKKPAKVKKTEPAVPVEIPPYLARNPETTPSVEFIERLKQKYASFDVAAGSKVMVEEAIENEVMAEDPKRGLDAIDISTYDFNLKEYGANVFELTVEPEETIGHYADWANVPTRLIRQLNKIKFGAGIRFGQKLRVPLTPRKLEKFKAKRIEHHLSIEEDFYSNFKLSGYTDHKIRRGDTLDSILRRYEVPLWLLRRVQPKSKPIRLAVGNRIRIPTVEAIAE